MQPPQEIYAGAKWLKVLHNTTSGLFNELNADLIVASSS